MQLRLSDPSYTDRLARFLESLGQTVDVVAPGELDVVFADASDAHAELLIYLRVWKVLYPDADVHVASGDVGVDTLT
jgi:hypothetical protein